MRSKIQQHLQQHIGFEDIFLTQLIAKGQMQEEQKKKKRNRKTEKTPVIQFKDWNVQSGGIGTPPPNSS